MAIKSISYTKNYNNFRIYLQRVHKIKNSGNLANYLITKITSLNTPTLWFDIFKFELIQAGILKEKETMYKWREEMCKKGILICQASFSEKDEKKPNFKAAKFKFGDCIKKYIETALHQKSSIFERLDLKADAIYVQEEILKVESQLAQKADAEDLLALKLETAKNKEQIADLNLKILDLSDNLETLLLFALPPDTSTRREIIRTYRHDKEECIKKLKEDCSGN